jgi:hypothetical protein
MKLLIGGLKILDISVVSLCRTPVSNRVDNVGHARREEEQFNYHKYLSLWTVGKPITRKLLMGHLPQVTTYSRILVRTVQ